MDASVPQSDQTQTNSARTSERAPIAHQCPPTLSSTPNTSSYYAEFKQIIHNLLYKLGVHTKEAEGHWRKAVLQRVTIETSEMMDKAEGSWYVSSSPQY